jgi:hypothetical protein
MIDMAVKKNQSKKRLLSEQRSHRQQMRVW